jgi:hypothetical protein
LDDEVADESCGDTDLIMEIPVVMLLIMIIVMRGINFVAIIIMRARDTIIHCEAYINHRHEHGLHCGHLGQQMQELKLLCWKRLREYYLKFEKEVTGAAATSTYSTFDN